MTTCSACVLAVTVCACVLGAAQETPSISIVERAEALPGLLDLEYPGLETVKARVDAGDLDQALRALVAYYRHRQDPAWPVDVAERPSAPDPHYSTAAADRVLQREFTFLGRTATLPELIDWDADPLGDIEWTVCLNQHGPWVTLARAYWHTRDEAYAADFVGQLRSWLDAYPQLDWRPPGKRTAWRSTLRAGIRMGGPWLNAFCSFVHSPSFSPTDCAGMLHSIAQHAEYLMKSRSGGNWLLFESRGLFNLAVMFPEFRRAAEWRATAVERMVRELREQVYPDGAQMELTPHYHGGCMSSFYDSLSLAKRHDVLLPADFLGQLEKMFDYALYLAKPDGYTPMLNDSDHDDYRRWFERGAELFGRQDMRYRATEGAEGEAPRHTSYVFPFAGFYVMRSGWDREARYLLFEAGPYGLGHQHEDKLQIDVHAYGRSLLMDPGRYTYVGGPWRRYFVGTESHCSVTVDGKGQNRRATDRSLWTVREPNDNVWISNETFDFAAGSYTDGYGPGSQVIHVRKVLFVKDRYWIVSDRLFDEGAVREHEFASQFQFGNAGVTVDEARVAWSHNEDANLLVLPAVPDQFAVDVVEGQTDPPRGWIGWSYHRNLKTPASMVTYRWTSACPAVADVVLYPYRGQERPAVTVSPLPAHGAGVTALQVRHEEGVDRILIQHGPSGVIDLGGEETDAAVAIIRSGLDGRTRLWAASDVSSLGSQAAVDRQPAGAVSVSVVDEHAVRLSWSPRDALDVRVEYGHEIGGGFLFRRDAPAGASGSVVLSNLASGLPYVFHVSGTIGRGQRAVLGSGRFVAASSAEYALDSRASLRGWSSDDSLRLVEDAELGRICLELSAPSTADVRYVTVGRSFSYRVTARTRVAFDYRSESELPGNGYYCKVNVTDREGEDWSVYLTREPTAEWQHADLGIEQFGADTREHRNRASTLPVETSLRSLRFTQRKGEAEESGTQSLRLANVRFYEKE